MDWMRVLARELVLVLCGFLVLGCEKASSVSVDEQPMVSDEVALDATGIELDAQVVVEREEANFWLARVVEVKGDTVFFEYGSGRTKGEAEKVRVYEVGKTASDAVKEGAYGICQSGPGLWCGCVVKAIRGGIYTAEDFWGKSYQLTHSQFILPSSETRDRIEKKHHEASGPRDFLKEATEAGEPFRPEGWSPRPGEDILARYTDATWYGGRIRRVTPTKVHIAWDDRLPASERDYGDVVPRPSKPLEVKEGQFVLGRPRSGAKWDYFRVEGVDSKGVLLIDKEGQKKKARKRDVIPLGS